MRIFKFNLTFLVIIISFCCSVAIGLPLAVSEGSALAKDSSQIPIDFTQESTSFSIEEILSPQKYLKKYLETAKKEGFTEKSPDREHQLIVMETETSSPVSEEDVQPMLSTPGCLATPVSMEQSLDEEKKGTQTPAVDNIPLQIVTGQESPSPPAVEECVNRTYVDDNKSLQFLTEEEPSAIPLEDKSCQEMSLIDEGRQPDVSFSETLQETKEEGTPATISTHEPLSETLVEEKPFPAETNGTQTPAVEQTTDENGLPFTSAEEPSYTATGESSDISNKDAKEPEKEISLPELPAKIVKKKTEDLKFTWDIWHTNPALSIVIAVAITLIAAKIGGWLASMVMLPEVVGNLIAGLILGNFFFFTGSEFFNYLRTMPFLKMISYFGTLLLLFTAGLHTDLRALLRVGASSFLVSLGGIIAPAGLGLIVGHFLLPDASFSSRLLLAIIICNTSTGLLFAILSELKVMNTREGRIITGATILTEIIVILTFGIASGIATKGEVSVMNVLVTAGIASSFLMVVLIIVLKYGEKFGNFLTSRVAEGLKISIVIILSLLFAFISGSIGLHGVIGAFAAGMLLRNVKFKDSDDKEYSTVERIIRPYYMILVPILFIRVGAQVDLGSILNKDAVLIGLAITGAAVLGKLFCSACPIDKGINRMAIGIGMAMKLEGTLILSGIARDMGILNDVVFSSIIMVIVFTSITCPSLLKASIVREKRRRCENFNVTVDENTKEIFVRFKQKVRG